MTFSQVAASEPKLSTHVLLVLLRLTLADGDHPAVAERADLVELQAVSAALYRPETHRRLEPSLLFLEQRVLVLPAEHLTPSKPSLDPP